MREDSITENMVQEGHTPAPLGSWLSRNAPFALASLTICLLVLAIYYHVLGKLVTDWQSQDNSHGFLVPLFAAFLVSLIILLAGLVLCFGGAQLLKELRFALLVLLLAIPLPAIIYNQITFPLQILASKLASNLLPYFGVPVLREGNVIDLPLMKLEVAEACSGIRSLMSLFTLAVFYGYFMEKSVWRRVVLVLASIPIAIAANAVRILGTGLCVQYWDPDKALGFFHEFSGWVIFLVSLVCLYLVHRAMNLFPAKRRQI
jgi:exosortase